MFSGSLWVFMKKLVIRSPVLRRIRIKKIISFWNDERVIYFDSSLFFKKTFHSDHMKPVSYFFRTLFLLQSEKPNFSIFFLQTKRRVVKHESNFNSIFPATNLFFLHLRWSYLDTSFNTLLVQVNFSPCLSFVVVLLSIVESGQVFFFTFFPDERPKRWFRGRNCPLPFPPFSQHSTLILPFIKCIIHDVTTLKFRVDSNLKFNSLRFATVTCNFSPKSTCTLLLLS